jgi:hypothetical protein
VKYLEVKVSARRVQTFDKVITVALSDGQPTDVSEVVELVMCDADDWDSEDADVWHYLRELETLPDDGPDFLVGDDGEVIESPTEDDLSLQEAKEEDCRWGEQA